MVWYTVFHCPIYGTVASMLRIGFRSQRRAPKGRRCSAARLRLGSWPLVRPVWSAPARAPLAALARLALRAALGPVAVSLSLAAAAAAGLNIECLAGGGRPAPAVAAAERRPFCPRPRCGAASLSARALGTPGGGWRCPPARGACGPLARPRSRPCPCWLSGSLFGRPRRLLRARAFPGVGPSAAFGVARWVGPFAFGRGPPRPAVALAAARAFCTPPRFARRAAWGPRAGRGRGRWPRPAGRGGGSLRAPRPRPARGKGTRGSTADTARRALVSYFRGGCPGPADQRRALIVAAVPASRGRLLALTRSCFQSKALCSPGTRATNGPPTDTAPALPGLP